jgi:hypothetical protein
MAPAEPRTNLSTPAVIAGRRAKAIEFLGAGETVLEFDATATSAAGDLFVDAGIAASDVVCCVRLGKHSKSDNHSEATALLAQADKGLVKHLNTLLGMKNKAAYAAEALSATECKKMHRAATHLVDAAKLATASRTQHEDVAPP